MTTHLIRWTKEYHVNWEHCRDPLQGKEKVRLSFMPGDVLVCSLTPDGPGHEEYSDERCEVFIPGKIDLWNVPENTFEILIGESTSSMRDTFALAKNMKGRQ